MRNNWSTIILVLTLPLGELHTFWANDTTVQNWIITEYIPMTVQWNIKFSAQELSVFAYFWAWVLWKENKVNRTTRMAFLWLAVMNVLLYFYNYKLGGFGKIYYWFAAFWIIVYKWNYFTNWLLNKLHPPK